MSDNPTKTPTKPRHNQCSYQQCPNGHTWAAQLALPHCQKCQNPLIALRMTNCPVCNEVVSKTFLRIDHLGGAHPITKTCENEFHVGPEYIFVEIDHQHTSWIANDAPKTDSTQQIIQTDVQKLESPDIQPPS